MAVTPINVARVSQNLRAFNLLNTVRANSLDLFRTQNQIATGLRFAQPSDDPDRAADSITLDRQMDILEQVRRNLDAANSVLREGESAMQAANDLVMQAHTLALQTVSDTTSPDDRDSLRLVAESIIDQLVAVGNRRYLDTFLFSGQIGDELPFEWIGDGVLFRGDGGTMQTIVESDLSADTFTIPGMRFFNAVSQGVSGFVDLDPAVTRATRLRDLNGATGAGVELGRIAVTAGAERAEIDLTGADTVGDLIDKLNDELPPTLQATLSGQAINIGSLAAGPGSITVTDVGGGNTAVELGIYSDTPRGAIIGEDLDPRLTPRTALKDLNTGSGIDLTGGLTIRLGSEVANIDFNGAETIEDVLNRIGQADVAVLARIADDGKTIEIRNRLSGAELRVGEHGGNAATALGIRSLYSGTPLSQLAGGLGIDTVDGNDLRVTTASGTTIDVDLDDLDLSTDVTLQDVIDLLNARGGGAITASLTTQDNGIRITDNTVGGGTLTIERLNVSPAIDGLGLNVSANGNTLTGTDTHPVTVDSPFTALLALREALARDDTRAISVAGEDLLRNLRHMQLVQGEEAAQAASMLERADRIENEVVATRVLQSDVRDADMTEVIVRFQQVQNALQANLATASQVMSLSLLDFLG